MPPRKRLEDLNAQQAHVTANYYWHEHWPLDFDDRELTERLKALIDDLIADEPNPLLLMSLLAGQMKIRLFDFKIRHPKPEILKKKKQLHLDAMMMDGVYQKLYTKHAELEAIVQKLPFDRRKGFNRSYAPNFKDIDILTTNQKVLFIHYLQQAGIFPKINPSQLSNEKYYIILSLITGNSKENIKKAYSHIHTNTRQNPITAVNVRRVYEYIIQFRLDFLEEFILKDLQRFPPPKEPKKKVAKK